MNTQVIKRFLNDIGWSSPPTSIKRKVIAQVSFTNSSYDESVNSRANSLQYIENDVDQKAMDFIKRDGTLPRSHHRRLNYHVSNTNLCFNFNLAIFT